MQKSIIDSLREIIGGDVLTPGDERYDEARQVWNGRFDRKPAAIVRCQNKGDVVAAVDAAREHDLLLSVRSGGHDLAGQSVCDGGLTIDLSLMKGIVVDPQARTAKVEPGVRWGELDSETQKHGLATTGGTVSTVGISGFTLGGGSGWLSRKHGLALDNLIGAEVVLADGSVTHASEEENPDLYWALRGGSGNFGVVTLFEYRLHPLQGELLSGQILYPFEAAEDVLRQVSAYMTEVPDEVQCYPFFLKVPPLEFFPEQYHGKTALDLVVAYMGDPAEGESVLALFAQMREPFFNGVAPQDYLTLQKSFDEGMLSGNRWYTKTHDLPALSDEAIKTLLEYTREIPGDFSMVYLEEYGGAIARTPEHATAFPHREAAYSLHIFPGWMSEDDDDEMIAWARRFHDAMEPYSTGGGYVNLLEGDEKDVARAAWAGNYDRLRKVKSRYDPDNVFRSNHNVKPA
ncbi:FAD-binding oxidoreductase [soil metagenome]